MNGDGRGAGHGAAEILAGLLVLAVAAGFLAYGLQAAGRTRAAGLRLDAEFDNIGTLAPGAEVRIAGVKVGRILRTAYDPDTYRARVDFDLDRAVRLPRDSSAQIASAGLLGGASLNLVPGGDTTVLRDGERVRITQSAASLEDMLGKFIFNVGSLADATQRQLRRDAATPHDAPAKAPNTP